MSEKSCLTDDLYAYKVSEPGAQNSKGSEAARTDQTHFHNSLLFLVLFCNWIMETVPTQGYLHTLIKNAVSAICCVYEKLSRINHALYSYMFFFLCIYFNFLKSLLADCPSVRR